MAGFRSTPTAEHLPTQLFPSQLNQLRVAQQIESILFDSLLARPRLSYRKRVAVPRRAVYQHVIGLALTVDYAHGSASPLVSTGSYSSLSAWRDCRRRSDH